MRFTDTSTESPNTPDVATTRVCPSSTALMSLAPLTPMVLTVATAVLREAQTIIESSS